MIEMQVETKVIQSRWGLAIGEDNQAPVIVRYLQEAPSASTRRKYPSLMIAEWKYEACMANGMPSRDQSQAMDILEGSLLKILEQKGDGILTSVVTQDGIREWQMYVSSPEVAETCVRNACSREDLDQLSVSTEPDPKWSSYRALMDALSV